MNRIDAQFLLEIKVYMQSRIRRQMYTSVPFYNLNWEEESSHIYRIFIPLLHLGFQI